MPEARSCACPSRQHFRAWTSEPLNRWHSDSSRRQRLDLALTYGSAQLTESGAATDVRSSGSGKIIRSEELKCLEHDSIIAALERARRTIAGEGGAAELLGVNPNTLASRMRALGIKRK